MLNILKQKQNINTLDTYSLNKYNSKIKTRLEKNEYTNTIYYPSSSKEWTNSGYTYNKSYAKTLITKHTMLNNLFRNYFNMFENKIKMLFKRRHASKKRYSANKIFVSSGELKHTNTKLFITLYIYDKKKSLIERTIKNLIKLTVYVNDSTVVTKSIYTSKLGYIFKRFLYFRRWNNVLFVKNNNFLKNMLLRIKKKYNKSHKMSIHNRLLKRLYRFERSFIKNTNLISFNKSKFNNLLLNLKGLGLSSLIEKIYNKNIKSRVVELKSIHLNSDVFSQAVALKLKDRKNRPLRILRKAVVQMVKIPDLHTLITFYDSIDNINKNNILNVMKNQIVSGVRFEARGRLTRRLTAMRAVFKYRYIGSLKNISSSFNNESTTMLRGHVKPSLEHTIINSKTRNGSFGLKGWVSSH